VEALEQQEQLDLVHLEPPEQPEQLAHHQLCPEQLEQPEYPEPLAHLALAG
jgi:hypothetical protein